MDLIDSHSNRTHRILLAAVLLIAAVARFYGIDFGLPHTECRPDETALVYKALGFFSGDLNPHFFQYPSLHLYLLAVVFAVYFGIRLPQVGSVSDLTSEVLTDPSALILVSRCFSAAFGVGTVYVLYVLGRRIFDRQAGMTAAFIGALCYLHVRDSHFGTTDVPMTFWILCAIWALVRFVQGGTQQDFTWAGIFSGLAASTKYGGVLLVVPALVAWVTRSRPKGKAEFGPRAFGLYIGAAAIAFVLTTPFAVLDFATFVSDLGFEAGHLRTGHAGEDLGRGWFYHARFTLPLGLGTATVLTGLAGMCTLALRERRLALVLFLFPVLFYAVAGQGHTVFLRYMVPILPFFCLGSAALVAVICRRIPWQWSPALLALVIVAEPSYCVIRLDRLLARTDNRVLVKAGVEARVPEGSTICQSETFWSRAQLTPSIRTLKAAYRKAQVEGRQARVLQARIRQAKDEGRAGYHLATDWEPRKEALPDFAVLYRSPLKAYTPVSIEAPLEERYDRVAAFEAIDLNVAGRFYDQQDAFFVPFRGFSGVTRPGPNAYLYALKRN